MTLITSLFNKGIFKNTIKRFMWGSILYFAIIFFTVPFPILMTGDYFTNDLKLGENLNLLLTHSEYIIFPLLVAVAASTVVAMLIQNSVHSAKQSIFTHGLPVTRKKIYFSQLASSAVLMILPVLANALILLLMSLSAYGKVITITSVFYWLAINLIMQFVMFSFAIFAGYLTGNTAAHVAINAFLHLLPVLVAFAISLISEVFLFGFIASDYFIAEKLIDYNPIMWLMSKIPSYGYHVFEKPALWLYVVLAVVLYIASYLLYKKRRIESCGDVAAFAAFRPILKYSMVTAVVTATFGMFYAYRTPALAAFIATAAIGAICYFAAEMILSKNVRVFGKYKGYLGFMAFAAVFIGFFAFTNVFGYETRIPKKDDIAAITVFYGYADEEQAISDSAFIDECIDIHKSLISDIPITHDQDYYHSVRIRYNLKNGDEINRYYHVDLMKYEDTFERLYEFEEYKLKCTGFNILKPENIDSAVLMSHRGKNTTSTIHNDEVKGLLAALEKDIRTMSYNDLVNDSTMLKINISIGLSAKENNLLHYFDDAVFGDSSSEYNYYEFSIDISSTYKNTFAYLKESGIFNELFKEMADNIVILKLPVNMQKDGSITYKNQSGELDEFMINSSDCVPLSHEDALMVIEGAATRIEDDDNFEGDYYYTYIISEIDGHLESMSSRLFKYKSTSLPEYLKKYVADA